MFLFACFMSIFRKINKINKLTYSTSHSNMIQKKYWQLVVCIARWLWSMCNPTYNNRKIVLAKSNILMLFIDYRQYTIYAHQNQTFGEPDLHQNASICISLFDGTPFVRAPVLITYSNKLINVNILIGSPQTCSAMRCYHCGWCIWALSCKQAIRTPCRTPTAASLPL